MACFQHPVPFIQQDDHEILYFFVFSNEVKEDVLFTLTDLFLGLNVFLKSQLFFCFGKVGCNIDHFNFPKGAGMGKIENGELK